MQRGHRLGGVARPRAPWPFVLHIKTSVEPKIVRVVRVLESSGDPDLLMHYVTCRAADGLCTPPNRPC
jgi:hypothetical protein